MKKSAVLFSFLFLVAFCTTVHANITYSFYNITNNSSLDIASQLVVEVANPGGGQQVVFTFRNLGPLRSFIKGVYFDDGEILGSTFGIDNSCSDVDFEQITNNPDLPGGGNLDPPFQTSEYFKARTTNPGTGKEGVDPGEWLGITFNLLSGKSYMNVLGDLETGNLRVGVHVGGFTDGESDSFVNNGIIPAPGAILLGSIGVALVGWLRRSKQL